MGLVKKKKKRLPSGHKRGGRCLNRAELADWKPKISVCRKEKGKKKKNPTCALKLINPYSTDTKMALSTKDSIYKNYIRHVRFTKKNEAREKISEGENQNQLKCTCLATDDMDFSICRN